MRGAYPLASMRLLSSIIGPAYISEPLLFPLIVLRMLRLSLEHGNAASSPYAYACYGTMLVSVANSTEKLDQIGELALNLLENFSDRAAEVRTKLIVGSHISHWKFHISRSLSLVQESYQIAANCGDLEFMGYSAQIICFKRYFMGQCLTELEPDFRAYCQTLQ